MRKKLLLLLFACALAHRARAQWQLQESHTTAGLRGIHAVNDRVAWASGAQGTILRTEDGGSHWRPCPAPPGTEELDFRGLWAWDGQSAMVMSAGPGDRSRLYQTGDGGAHWIEVAKNSDQEGFWDALVFAAGDFARPQDKNSGVLVGDPVSGRFYTRIVLAAPASLLDDASCRARAGESAFAASNSAVFVFGPRRYIIGTGGKGGPRALLSAGVGDGNQGKGCREVSVPLQSGTDSAGVFSLAFRDRRHGIAVGGDYKRPEATDGTAARTSSGGLDWIAAARPPHGFRSAVSFDAAAKAWIASGANGSDVSYDDGRTWQALDNGSWNALSLPYAVGPGGRIGRLRPDALRLRRKRFTRARSDELDRREKRAPGRQGKGSGSLRSPSNYAAIIKSS